MHSVNPTLEYNFRYKLKLQNTTSLDMPAPQLARDFFTTEEMKEKASFKKVKKKKNKEGVRKSKMLKADDLLAMTSVAGAQQPVRYVLLFWGNLRELPKKFCVQLLLLGEET